MSEIVIKDFYADWCGPCDQQEPILEEIDEERDDVTLEKYDVETSEGSKVGDQYSVRSLPTIIIEKDGDVIQQFTGLTQKQEIEGSIP